MKLIHVVLRRTLLGLFLLVGLWGCRPDGLRGWVFYKYGGELRYQIGKLSSSWRRITITQNDLAFYHRIFKSIIQVNSTCRKDYEDVSLSTLTDHIFYGLKERKILLQTRRMIDNREGLYTELVAKLDGVPIKAAVLVIKKNACIYDFAYIARPHNFGRGLGDFYRVIYGFKVKS